MEKPDPDSRAALDAAFATAALVAGTLSLVVSGGWLWWMQRTGSTAIGIRAFVVSWVVVAIVAAVTGRLRLSLVALPQLPRLGTAILPPLAAAAGASTLFFWNGAAYGMSVVWITCWGLALLNLRELMSSAIIKTGWLFLGTGIALMSLVYYSFKTLNGIDRSDTQTLFIMALTFGAFHLLHALGHALRKQNPGKV